MFIQYEPNNKGTKQTCDCAIRAICKLEDKSWLEVFDELVIIARKMQDMPDSTRVIKKYLKMNGWIWVGIKSAAGKSRPTVHSFTSNNSGAYILSLAGHVVACNMNDYYDREDCGDSCIYGYWYKE